MATEVTTDWSFSKTQEKELSSLGRGLLPNKPQCNRMLLESFSLATVSAKTLSEGSHWDPAVVGACPAKIGPDKTGPAGPILDAKIKKPTKLHIRSWLLCYKILVNSSQFLKKANIIQIMMHTVEPLYNGHFRSILLLAIQRLSFLGDKNVSRWPVGTKILCP